MISWFGEAWYDEVVPGSEMALERLIELMLAGQSVDRFYRRVRSLDSLEASHQLQPLIDLWRAYGVVDVRANAETIANRTNGKYLIVHQDTDAGHVKFCEFGKTKWAVYDSSRWMTKCIGQRVQDQPDYEYGCWTANAYRHAMLDSVPTLSDMDTLVLDATGGGHRRLQYIRLTLPVRGRDGSRQMLSTSCHDLSVDLRPPIH